MNYLPFPRSPKMNVETRTTCLVSPTRLESCREKKHPVDFATLVAPFRGKTTMWEGVPIGLADIDLFSHMSIIVMLEGMQLEFLAVVKISEDECRNIF